MNNSIKDDVYNSEIDIIIKDNFSLNKKKIFNKLLKLNFNYSLIKNKLELEYEECVNNELYNIYNKKYNKDKVKNEDEENNEEDKKETKK